MTNPDISVIGQPTLGWSDEAGSPSRKRPVFDVGETELVLDAALNPYARGSFTLTFADGEAGVEEAWFTIDRGLPGTLALKGGKYRAGFGKVNPAHPHTYPFGGEPFRVLRAYLPGADGFNDTGVQLSARLAGPGDVAWTASVDALQGDVFRIAREPSGASDDPLVADPERGDLSDAARTAVLGRVSAFVPVGDRSGLEFGVSGTQGTNNVAAAARTTVIGGDVKAKLWAAPNAYLLVQSEVLGLRREEASWDEAAAAYAKRTTKPSGGYVFADWNWAARYDVGASYERFQQPAAGNRKASAFGVFAGLALMEETTAFRIGWERFVPGRTEGATEHPDAVHTVTLRVIYSMGPHKAHQF